MLEIEIDGRTVQVAEGSTVIQAAHQLGIYIPHFCYHKKLSIAASCRMCLVQVEKAPKPLPACATPVTAGMKVFTHSELAVQAQQAVMEFILINHPLDCPICDQGGECQLQDLAVGYGGCTSRYEEEKRVVSNKNLGPLVSTDMTRCIHCTRCVRFTQEIAGYMEMGQANRGEHAEIMPFIGKTIDSELSGNIIDLCPVGALTSKPFRFAARTWELSRRKSVSPHDGLGSTLIVQSIHNKVLRVLPLENEDINECWISDKDRFSYEGLNSAERLTKPMIKQGGQWQEVEWNIALDYAAHALRNIAKENGGSAIGAMVSPHATLEELTLAGKLVRGLGSDNIDFRLRQSDFSLDGKGQGVPWLGMKISDTSKLDRALIVGSFLRKDQPLIAQRLRQAAKRGAQLSVIHSVDEDLLLKSAGKMIVAPSRLPEALAEVVKAVAEAKGVAGDAQLSSLSAVVPSEAAKRIAESLVSGEKSAVLLGNYAQQHPQGAKLHVLAAQLSALLGGKFGFLGEAANSVGGFLANALPKSGGMNAARMLSEPLQAYLVLHAEPELDCADGRKALEALNKAKSVVVLSPFKSAAALDYADVLLPVAPYTETSGSFVNTEGRIQSFHAVTKPNGEARPAWKVLRVLGNLLCLDGFGHESSEDVRNEVFGGSTPEFAAGLDNSTAESLNLSVMVEAGIERVADVPTYSADALVRRAPSLQKSRDAVAPAARMNAAMLDRAGFATGGRLRIRQGAGEAILVAQLDNGVPDGCVRIAAAHPDTSNLGAMHGTITLEAL